VRVPAGERQQDRDRGAERGDLGEREVDEDDAPLDHVHAQVGVYPGEDQAGDERRREKPEDVEVHGYLAPVSWMAAESSLMS
jgi:hypothetical protein